MLTENGGDKLAAFAASAYPKQVTQAAQGVWHVMGYGHSNAIIIEAEHSVILVDTLDSDARGRVLRQIAGEKTGKPVETIIYTHGHPDHRGGASAFADTVKEIIAFAPSKPPTPYMDRIGGILSQRGSRQMGYALTDAEALTQGIGIREGIAVGDGKMAPLPPTTVYHENEIERTVDGVRLKLAAVPGETDDQLLVWLPDCKVLCCGDNYYGCWPNLYAIRGSQYRDIATWVASLDILRGYPAQALLPGHTKPILGAGAIQETLGNFRDAIHSILMQTLDGLNQGRTADELAATVRLPDHLRDLPYLQEFYGTVAWSVRAICDGYVGWFDGNATNLNRSAPDVYGKNMLRLIGPDKLRGEIAAALADGRYQWAAELCDLLLSAGESADEAKAWKAQALLSLANQETSANGRHYYIASAKELQAPPDAGC